MKTLEQCLDIALDTPYAHGGPIAKGLLRQHAEDYCVNEIPLLEPEGAGEHIWLKIRKRHTNTDFVAKQLQKLAGVKPVAVSYAGMKDRHALTTQWFSVHIPSNDEPDWYSLNTDDIGILDVKRHSRKLRRGTLWGNQFSIQIRDIDVESSELQQRVEVIKKNGVPNFFAGQRFGHDGGNLINALAMFTGDRRVKRHQRSLYLSSARSLLFNYILAERVRAGNWCTIEPGDVCLRTGRRGFFLIEAVDEALQQRLDAAEIHPTAPLWGRGELPVTHAILKLEQQLPVEFPQWCAGLEQAGLKMERRECRLVPENLSCQKNDEGVKLDFDLPAGCYATSVIRELFNTSDYRRFNKT